MKNPTYASHRQQDVGNYYTDTTLTHTCAQLSDRFVEAVYCTSDRTWSYDLWQRGAAQPHDECMNSKIEAVAVMRRQVDKEVEARLIKRGWRIYEPSSLPPV